MTKELVRDREKQTDRDSSIPCRVRNAVEMSLASLENSYKKTNRIERNILILTNYFSKCSCSTAAKYPANCVTGRKTR